MARPRGGSRTMGGPIGLLVPVETRIGGDVLLPADRYAGTVTWKETATRSGVERSRKRYRIELSAGDLARWGGAPAPGEAARRIDVSAEVASGSILTL